jgi:hypothetical protein
MRTYGRDPDDDEEDDPNDVDWITAGILYVNVSFLGELERKRFGLVSRLEGTATCWMAVTTLDLNHPKLEIVWTDYFHKRYN